MSTASVKEEEIIEIAKYTQQNNMKLGRVTHEIAGIEKARDKFPTATSAICNIWHPVVFVLNSHFSIPFGLPPTTSRRFS